MENIIKSLQKLQLKAYRKGIGYSIEANSPSMTSVTDITVQAFHSTVCGNSDVIDNRNFRATFSTEDSEEINNSKLLALTKFINDISK